MKQYISIFALALAAVGFTSCEKDTEGLTGITVYPVLTMEGPSKDLVIAGQPYQDPGCVATLDGEDVSDEIQVITDMNLQSPAPGYYTITYRVVNSDGFDATAKRNVLVTDANDKAAGYYTVQANSYRLYNGNTVYYGGEYPLVIAGDGQGNYEVDDLLGGWYCYRAGYGSQYAMQGEISIDADGNITLEYSFIQGWGDSANDLTDGKFDAATGTITWALSYTDYPFIFTVIAVNDNF